MEGAGRETPNGVRATEPRRGEKSREPANSGPRPKGAGGDAPKGRGFSPARREGFPDGRTLYHTNGRYVNCEGAEGAPKGPWGGDPRSGAEAPAGGRGPRPTRPSNSNMKERSNRRQPLAMGMIRANVTKCIPAMMVRCRRDDVFFSPR
jgi:hypothetical protein